MPRPTVQQRIGAAVIAERRACQEFIRDKIAEVDRLRSKSRVTAAEASLLNRRLDAIVDGIEARLHIAGGA